MLAYAILKGFSSHMVVRCCESRKRVPQKSGSKNGFGLKNTFGKPNPKPKNGFGYQNGFPISIFLLVKGTK